MASAKKPIAGPPDLLTTLPDPIVHLILSFLPPRDAARTALLSKSWSRIYNSSPDLRFHSTSELIPPSLSDSLSALLARRSSSSPVRYLALDLHFIPAADLFSAIRLASSLSISDLDVRVDWLELDSQSSVSFSEAISTCSPSLHSLKLYFPSGVLPLHLPETIQLSRLRVLHHHFNSTAESVSRLISACPLLEELSLMSANFPVSVKGGVLNISAARLRVLQLSFARCLEPGRVLFSCPRLEVLELWCPFPLLEFRGEFSSLDRAWEFPSLDRAVVSVSYGDELRFGQFVGRILDAVRNAKGLRLFSSLPKLHPSLNGHLPEFCKLRSLDLAVCFHNDNTAALTCLLENAPNLSSLRISLQSAAQCRCQSKGRSRKSRKLPLKILDHLQEVVFFTYIDRELTGTEAKFLESWSLRAGDFVRFLSQNVTRWEGVVTKLRTNNKSRAFLAFLEKKVNHVFAFE